MDSARIAELLDPFLGPPDDRRLTTGDLDQISTYIDLLLRWNARINLTAIRDPEQIVSRHFGESFFLARHLFPRVERILLSSSAPGHDAPPPPAVPTNASAAKRRKTIAQGVSPGLEPDSGQAPEGRKKAPSGELETAAPSIGQSLTTGHQPLPTVVDLGSGAGFPALPLKIWAPEIHLTLVESNHKKAAFLREVIRALTLTNVDVIAARAETLLPSRPAAPAQAYSEAEHLSHPNVNRPANSTPSPCHSERPRSPASPVVGERGWGREESASPVSFLPADIVTFRAVEKFHKILPLATSFLAPHGRLALLISSAQITGLDTKPPMKWRVVHIPESHMRVLAIGAIS